MRAFVAVILMVIVSCAMAQSPDSPQAPEVKSEKNKAYTKQSPENSVSAPSASTKKENPKDSSPHGAEEGTELWPAFYGIRVKITDSLLGIFTLALSIFTALLWYSTYKLWKETKATSATAEKAANAATRSAVVAETALIVTERAYVSILTADRDVTRAYPTFVMRFKNTGHTQAMNVVPTMRVHLAEWPLTSKLPSISEGMAKSTLGPNCEAGMIASWSEKIIDPEHDPRFSGGKSAIYIYGRIEYEDAFGTKRFTNYRFAYHLAGTGKLLVSPESDGNDSS